MREFWRRWNITLLTWLRDYLRLPIAGQDRPTPRHYATTIAGFCLVGWWHGAGAASVLFGVYFGTLLAIEAAGLGRVLERTWKPVRHAYVLTAVLFGWIVAQAGMAAPLYVKAMLGLNAAPRLLPAAAGLDVWLALAFAVLAAGPLIPSVSRWRVAVDAAATSLLMMAAATALFVWRPFAIVLRSRAAS
jgi:alginate O-acetyltransferase complex protein AlgI